MINSIGRPLMPPSLLMGSVAICTPTSAVLPPAAPAPESGLMAPILYGLAWPNAACHGAGTSMVAPSAAAFTPQPTTVRRVVLPLYQKSFAHSSSLHFSVIATLPLDLMDASPAHTTCARQCKSGIVDLEIAKLNPRAGSTAGDARSRESGYRTPMPSGTTRHQQSLPCRPLAGSS